MNRLEEFEANRQRLFGIAYRMLGSAADAEDLVQETWLRWAQDSAVPQSARAYLTTILTRLCIDHLRSARVQRESYVGTWLPEPVALRPDPAESAELADSLSMAFLLTLERLSATQRAAFLLHDVFGAGYEEVAGILGKSEAACRQIVRRARAGIRTERQEENVPEAEQRVLLEGFLGAIMRGDYEALVSMLKEDAVLYADHGGKAASVHRNIYGADKIARLMLGLARRFPPKEPELQLLTINGATGVLIREAGIPTTVLHIDYHCGRIGALYQVRNPEKLSSFTRSETG